jgi:hypothetical protein
VLVHRVIRRKDTRFLLKGDNCSDADGWIPGEDILGLVTGVERGGKALFWPRRSDRTMQSRIHLFVYPCWILLRRRLAWARLRLRRIRRRGALSGL